MPDPRVYENASVLFMDIVSYSKQTVAQQARQISLLPTAVNQNFTVVKAEISQFCQFCRGRQLTFLKHSPGPDRANWFTRSEISLKCH